MRPLLQPSFVEIILNPNLPANSFSLPLLSYPPEVSYLLIDTMRLSILLPALASALAAAESLNITTLAARNNRSTLECWALEPDFAVSTESGTAGSKSLSLGPIGGSSNSSYSVIPAKFDGGRHNAPALQYVYPFPFTFELCSA